MTPSDTTSDTTTTESSQPDKLSPLPEGVITLSQIDDSMVNTYVRIQGKITIVHKDPEGLALWLSEGNDRIGVRIENGVWDSMSAKEQSRYEAGNTIIAEGMLVMTSSQELFVVVGVSPPTEGTPPPLFADVEVVTGPINISQQPNGSRGWPWPKIYLRNGKIIVTYRGEVNGWPSQWLIESDDGTTWSSPKELPPGEVVIGDKGAFTLAAWKYTPYEDQGNVGVVLNVLDDGFDLAESITIDTKPCLHSIDKSTFPEGVIDDQGNIHIVWVADTDIGTDVYYAVYDGDKLSDPVPVSQNPDMGSINHKLTVDDKGVVYVSWAESLKPWDPETEGGFPDTFYSYLFNSVWSPPRNLSNTPDWGEYGAILFSNGQDIHVFCGSSRLTEPGQMTYMVIRENDMLRVEKANFSFTDISMIFNSDNVHAVYGSWGYKDPYVSADGELVLEGRVYYNYFDGQSWYAGMGAELLSQEFLDNSEKPKLVAETIQSGYQDRIVLSNGETDLYREIHPKSVYKDGLIYTIFEHIQNGTADAYLVVFKPNNP